MDVIIYYCEKIKWYGNKKKKKEKCGERKKKNELGEKGYLFILQSSDISKS